MPVKLTLPQRSILSNIEKETAKLMKLAVRNLCYVGERCIIEAREGGTYEDITGNLRSSIGYAVVYNGEIVTISTPRKVKDGVDGVSTGSAFIHNRANLYRGQQGAVLIVTAGMNYAEYVEARGRVVLSKAREKAPGIVRSLMLQLGFTVS